MYYTMDQDTMETKEKVCRVTQVAPSAIELPQKKERNLPEA